MTSLRTLSLACMLAIVSFGAEARTRHVDADQPAFDRHAVEIGARMFIRDAGVRKVKVARQVRIKHKQRISIMLATAASDAVISEAPLSAKPAGDIPADVVERESAVGPDAEAKDAEDDLSLARDYLVRTATPGGTMSVLGAKFAVAQLHPTFVRRAAAAIAEARASGLHKVGIFSCYRPPGLGVGGFANKFNSLHTYGLAADFTGIGSVGSREAKLWFRIATKHKLYNPYGPNSRAEFNHYQATRLTMIGGNHPLRRTVTARGARNLQSMWRVGAMIIDHGPVAHRYARHHRHRHVRMAVR